MTPKNVLNTISLGTRHLGLVLVQDAEEGFMIRLIFLKMFLAEAVEVVAVVFLKTFSEAIEDLADLIEVQTFATIWS